MFGSSCGVLDIIKGKFFLLLILLVCVGFGWLFLNLDSLWLISC